MKDQTDINLLKEVDKEIEHLEKRWLELKDDLVKMSRELRFTMDMVRLQSLGTKIADLTYVHDRLKLMRSLKRGLKHVEDWARAKA